MYLSFLFFLSSIFFLGALIPFHRMMWASLLLGGFLSFLALWVFHRLILRFGVSKFLLCIEAFFSAFLGALTLYCLSEFFSFCVLQELPMWFFPSAFLICCGYAAVKDVYVLERFSKLCGPAVIFLLVLALGSGISKIRISFNNGFFSWQDFIYPSDTTFFVSVFFFAVLFFIEGSILITLLNTRLKNLTPFKSTMKGFFLSILFLSCTYLITVLVLGPYVFELLTYPIYYPPGLTGDAEYLERIEIVFLAVFLISEFVKISLCLLMIKETFLSFLRKKKRKPLCHTSKPQIASSQNQ